MDTTNVLLPLIRIFQITNLSPFSTKNNKNRFKIIFSYIYSILMILFCGLILSASIYNRKLFLGSPKSAELNKTMSFIILVGNWIVLLVVMIESLLKKKKQMEFYQILSEIDETLEKTLNFNLSKSMMRWSMIGKLVLWISFYSAMKVCHIFYLLKSNQRNSLFFWSISLIPYFICSLRYFQIICHIDLLKQRVNIFHKLLIEMKTPDGQIIVHKRHANLLNHFKEKQDYEQLLILRDVYGKLWHLSNLINECFGWSILVNIGNDFVSVTSASYNLFYSLSISNGFQITSLLEFLKRYGDLIWGFPYFISVILLSVICQKTDEMVSFFLFVFLEK